MRRLVPIPRREPTSPPSSRPAAREAGTGLPVRDPSTHDATAAFAVPSGRRIAVLMNGAAGPGASGDRRREVEEAFSARGVAVLVVAVEGERLGRVVRRLLREGVDVVVAGGGDGTISAVAHELVGSDASLGVIPLGTLNHFARDAGIPLALEDAVEAICRGGDAALVDVGEVNGRTFLNNVSLGVYPDQVRLRHRLKKRLGKWAAALVAGLAALRRLRSLRISVAMPGEVFRRHSPMIMVGNNEYGIERGNPTGRARLDAGTLSLYLFSEKRRLGLVIGVIRVLLGLPGAVPLFEARAGSELTIEVRRERAHVALDGEPRRLRSPLRFRSRPRALRLLGARGLA